MKKTAVSILTAMAMLVLLVSGCSDSSVETTIASEKIPTETTSTSLSETPTETTETVIEETNPSLELESLHLEVTTGSITIKPGDSLAAVNESGDEVPLSVLEGNLTIDANVEKITVTLPEFMTKNLEELRILTGAGHIRIETPVTTQNFDAKLEIGALDINSLTVSEKGNLDVQTASAAIAGSFGADFKVTSAAGNVSLKVKNGLESYNYNLLVELGDIDVGSEHYHGSVDETIDNQAEQVMTLHCSFGHVSVQ